MLLFISYFDRSDKVVRRLLLVREVRELKPRANQISHTLSTPHHHCNLGSVGPGAYPRYRWARADESPTYWQRRTITATLMCGSWCQPA